MSYTTQRSHKILALVAALVITVLVQGSLVAGFDEMASEPVVPVTTSEA